MDTLSPESINQFFAEMHLESDDLRSDFTKYARSPDMTPSSGDHVFIRIQNNTSIQFTEEPPNAQLA
jgi:hypothetical protein